METNRSATTTTTSLSLGTIGLITFIVFLCLKLNHVWDLNWFWVFFPLWLPFAIDGAILLICLVIIFIAALIGGRD